MFQLEEQKPIELEEFLNDYDPASWLGFLNLNHNNFQSSQYTVRRAIRRDFSESEDVYLAYNPLKTYSSRSKKNIGRLALLFVDLDIGRGENPFEDSSTKEYKQEVVNSLINNVFGITAPEPNFICDSGRGLYLIYKIYQNENKSKQEHANAALRWERVNTFLTKQFELFCADKSVCTDEARVLRIPGSINSHSKTPVKFYSYSQNTYTLRNIERDYMSEPTTAQIEKLERVEAMLNLKCSVRNRRSIRRFLERNEKAYKVACNKQKPSEKQLKFAADIARVLDLKCPNFRTAGGASRFISKYKADFFAEKAKRKNHKNYISNNDEMTLKMLEKRLKSIEKVLLDAPKDSYRETGLFLYRMFACEYTGNKKLAADMTRKLLANMANPISEKSAMRTTKTAENYWENGTIYKMKDSTLAEWFGMSLDEWKDLIPKNVSEDDKSLRKARNRRYYEKKLNVAGESTKKSKIIKRREALARLLSDGKNKLEICSILEISERTYYSDLKSIKINAADAKAQDIEIGSAEKSDASSNSVPIGTIVGNNGVSYNIPRNCMMNPFEDYVGVVEKKEPGEWFFWRVIPIQEDG